MSPWSSVPCPHSQSDAAAHVQTKWFLFKRLKVLHHIEQTFLFPSAPPDQAGTVAQRTPLSPSISDRASSSPAMSVLDCNVDDA
ncbi:hypothetical protein ACJMK2_014103, partial [Sinanodonta woodiana]